MVTTGIFMCTNGVLIRRHSRIGHVYTGVSVGVKRFLLSSEVQSGCVIYPFYPKDRSRGVVRRETHRRGRETNVESRRESRITGESRRSSPGG